MGNGLYGRYENVTLYCLPDINTIFTEDRQHAISRCPTLSTFNAVSPDMALEQTENKDSKTKGGIGGARIEQTHALCVRMRMKP